MTKGLTPELHHLLRYWAAPGLGCLLSLRLDAVRVILFDEADLD